MESETKEQSIIQSELGVSMLEILVIIILLTITAAGITTGVRTSLMTTKLTEYNHIASSLAVSKMEELASVNVSFLDNSYNANETAVTWPGSNETFTRVTSVVVNADDSRTLTVQVTANNEKLGTTVEFSNTLALWE